MDESRRGLRDRFPDRVHVRQREHMARLISCTDCRQQVTAFPKWLHGYRTTTLSVPGPENCTGRGAVEPSAADLSETYMRMRMRKNNYDRNVPVHTSAVYRTLILRRGRSLSRGETPKEHRSLMRATGKHDHCPR